MSMRFETHALNGFSGIERRRQINKANFFRRFATAG